MLCKKSLIWFYRTRRQVDPWVVLAIATCRIAVTNGIQREQEKVRWMLALAKIDFVKLIGFLHELLW